VVKANFIGAFIGRFEKEGGLSVAFGFVQKTNINLNKECYGTHLNIKFSKFLHSGESLRSLI
jgi:hypothetical protein